MSDEHQTDAPGVDERHDPEAHSSGAAVAHASRHENPSDQAESLGTGLGDQATGDIVIDSALQDLQNAPQDDLDAQIDAGQRVQQTLQARLSDLGGE
ncbi:hypothetical protein [Pedococcus bigeumensis]|uniref:hypothetical protein n=1 Tax=Pedococcus bigeumensis TaxID=433644 RepID=UPI002FEA6CD9